MPQERSAIADGVPEGTDPASPEETGPAALAPGTPLGAYEIGRRLGAGSMGAVYEGVRVADGKPVAIKVLAADLAEKPTARARFLNEATLTARVSHPHAVAVIDSGEASDRVFLVMELLEGEDLARRLRGGGPLSVDEAIEVLGPICDALASAHRAGVIHRDLKPANIFLAVREGRLHPMLLDFGVATDEVATQEGDASGPLTWNGVGTPMYLAPELVADHRAAGPASDQYALGAILYEMLTGEPPYAAGNLQQLLQTIAAGHPPTARARRPELPPKLDAVVLRAMCADPQGRFPSVEALGQALQPFAGSPAAEAPERRRPASSPAIDLETETPSPFVRTLVPEHEAKSGAWFVAPDAGEIPEDELELFESESLRHDPVSAESPRLPDEDPGVEAESPDLEAVAPRPEASPPSAPVRGFPAIDWRVVSVLAGKHRRILVSSSVALLCVVMLFAIRGGRTGSRPVSAPPATGPMTVETPAPAAPAAAKEAAPTPVAPAAPAAAEKAEPTAAEKAEPPPAAAEKAEPAPATPPAAAAVEKSAIAAPTAIGEGAAAAVRAAAPPTVEKSEPAPTRPISAFTTSTGTDAARDRSKAARRERPAPVRAESPAPKVASPAPAPKPRAPESAPVRMHNGVPLLD